VSRPARALLGLAAAVGLACAANAQRPNDPATCPWCHDDPELMAAAGIVSHGGFEFGSTDTAAIDELMATSDIRWIETPHFQIGFGLGYHKVKQEEKAKIRAELQRLAATLPEVSPRIKTLDPWLRAHLYAQRCEDLWTRFLGLMQVAEEDFPESGPWNMQGKYMGEGPYIGQKGKFELLILPSEAALTTFLREQFGLLIKQTQRWNIISRDTLIAVIHAMQGNLRDDQALHGHVTFNLTINLLDGYKHYSYESPIWIREGLGHFLEREIDPSFNTFDSSEGAVADKSNKEDWGAEVRKLLAKGETVRMAELVNLKSYAELELRHHYTTWSMIEYLVAVHPDGFACLNDRLHGRTDAQGIGDGSNMDDAHREAFKECIGMGYAEFDRAWAEWAQATY
jgi:glutaredoxin